MPYYMEVAGRSTELQLIEFYRNISRATNHSFNTDIINISIWLKLLIKYAILNF